jgi:hypothetical protein
LGGIVVTEGVGGVSYAAHVFPLSSDNINFEFISLILLQKHHDRDKSATIIFGGLSAGFKNGKTRRGDVALG